MDELQKAKPEFAGLLGQPVFPYLSNYYLNLVSVAQNVAIAAIALLVVNWEKDNAAFSSTYFPNTGISFSDLALRCFVDLAVVAAIWHRYFGHSHFIAWLPSWWDTVVLVAYPVVQSGMILYTPHKEAKSFLWWILATAVWGIFAYSRVLNAFQTELARSAYRNHYGEKIGKSMFEAIQEYNLICVETMFAVIYVLSVGLALIALVPPSSLETIVYGVRCDTIICALTSCIAIAPLLLLDLSWWLRRQEFVKELIVRQK